MEAFDRRLLASLRFSVGDTKTSGAADWEGSDRGRDRERSSRIQGKVILSTKHEDELGLYKGQVPTWLLAMVSAAAALSGMLLARHRRLGKVGVIPIQIVGSPSSPDRNPSGYRRTELR